MMDSCSTCSLNFDAIALLRAGSPIDEHGDPAHVTFSPDSEILLTSSNAHPFQLWEVNRGFALRQLHTSPPEYLVWPRCSPSGGLVVGGSWTGIISVLEMATGTILRQKTLGNENALHAAFSPNMRHILVSYGNMRNRQTPMLLDAETLDEVSRFAQDTNDAFRAVYSPDGSLIATGHFESVRLWDAQSLAEVARLAVDDLVKAIAFTPDSQRVVVATNDIVRIMTVHPFEELFRLRNMVPLSSPIAISPDGRFVLCGNQTRRVYLYDIEERELVREFDWFTTVVHSAAISPDNRFIAVGDWDGWVTVWPMI